MVAPAAKKRKKFLSPLILAAYMGAESVDAAAAATAWAEMTAEAQGEWCTDHNTELDAAKKKDAAEKRATKLAAARAAEVIPAPVAWLAIDSNRNNTRSWNRLGKDEQRSLAKQYAVVVPKRKSLSKRRRKLLVAQLGEGTTDEDAKKAWQKMSVQETIDWVAKHDKDKQKKKARAAVVARSGGGGGQDGEGDEEKETSDIGDNQRPVLPVVVPKKRGKAKDASPAQSTRDVVVQAMGSRSRWRKMASKTLELLVSTNTGEGHASMSDAACSMASVDSPPPPPRNRVVLLVISEVPTPPSKGGGRPRQGDNERETDTRVIRVVGASKGEAERMVRRLGMAMFKNSGEDVQYLTSEGEIGESFNPSSVTRSPTNIAAVSNDAPMGSPVKTS